VRPGIVFFVFAALVVVGIATPVLGSDRDEEPVLIRGERAPALIGEHLGHIRVHRFDPTAGAFEPIPVQVDERVEHTFNPGTAGAFVETIYDVLGEDDGMFDADDEIAFLFADAGPRAPAEAAWPAGAEDRRLEIEIRDPRPNAPEPSRWAYVFTGEALPASDVVEVTWDLRPDSTILSDAIRLTFEDRWLLTEFRVEAPCGTGEDLIDRVKGRARVPTGIQEDEEGWNRNSSFLGGIVGPVRAIRYVRGATSGLNTIHHDVVYRRWWTRTVNLRVHPLLEAEIYFDLSPIPGTTYYSPIVPDGVPVDGAPDAISDTFVGWSVVSGPGGGFVSTFDVPANPRIGSRAMHYLDDASVDDDLHLDPVYPDDDDAAIGAHGVAVRDLADTNLTPATLRTTVRALCSNEGDGGTGAAFRQIADTPFALVVELQERGAAPFDTLAVARQGDDVALTWQEIAGAVSYRVLRAVDPGLPPESWIEIGVTATPSFVDPGAAILPVPLYYSVEADDTAAVGGRR